MIELISDKLIFNETEIFNVYDVVSIKFGHFGTILKDDKTDKFVFLQKIKQDGTINFLKCWHLAKILIELNRLNKKWKQ